MSGFVSFNNQVYSQIKNECTFPNEPFQDDMFPPMESSLSPTGKIPNIEGIEWRRPKDICEMPCMFIDGSSTRDVCQGHLGNCWFISSMAVLALHPKCLNKVIPSINDQENQFRNVNKYAGIFQFQFWRYGEWVQVVIDDSLPTINNKLVFAHSKDNNEFWSALVEKAYAKVCGSYESMIGGQEEEALVDFCGGVPEQIFELKQYLAIESDMESLFKLLELDTKDKSLICASISTKHGQMEEKLQNGLISTHAYSVTGIARISEKILSKYEEIKGPDINLIRIRNPWGHKEWSGEYSDKSNKWINITQADKKKIGLKIENDGEFWMLFCDFLKNFNQLTIVRQIETGVLRFNTKWYGTSHRGYWTSASLNRNAAIRGDDGGGQQRIDINKYNGDVILIHLLQRCPRMMDTYLAVMILKVEHNRQTMMHSAKWGTVALEYRLGGSRAICLRYRLPFGTYIIRPYPTQNLKGNKPLYYILRCYTTNENYGLNLPVESLTSPSCCSSTKHKIITRINIIQADMWPTKKSINVSRTYCEIKCENKIYKTTVSSNTTTCYWNDTFMLYRITPEMPIIVSIIELGRVMNSTLGCVAYNFKDSDLNTSDVIISIDPVFESDLRTISTTFKSLYVQLFHTNDSRYL